MWRAARSGLVGELVVPGQRAPVPAADAVHGLLAQLRPQLTEFGDWDVVRQLATDALARGTSAERQRAALRRRGRLTDIVDQVVAETETAHRA
jgi:carboxylate-amine ligase